MCQQERERIEAGERNEIAAGTARISWRELELFYAKGMVILVSAELDLIKVAHCLSLDDSKQIAEWIDSKRLLRSFDEQAGIWLREDTEVWSVVIKPWVLVQEK